MMKDFLKFVISTLFVIAIVFIIDFSFGSFLEKKAVFVDQPKYERIKQASEEVIVLGASRADNQYVTSIIESELGTTAYNYGVGAQNVFTNYAILNLLINKSKQKPRIVIWDF